MIDDVDPFIGTGVADDAAPTGLAATWWSPKPPVGNTHPGATFPFGMISACATSGAYPTGYGLYDRSTEGVPAPLHDRLVTSGVTHFHQSGTGAIRKYYNYLRVTPLIGPLNDVDRMRPVVEEAAEPGYYAATLADGIRGEITVGPKSAVHRYTFPAHTDARLVLDASHGGLLIEHGATTPQRAALDLESPGRASGHVVMEGVPICFHVECDTPGWSQALWYDHQPVAGGTTLRFDAIRPTTLRPFGLVWNGAGDPERSIEIRIGVSLRSTEQARANLDEDLASVARGTTAGAHLRPAGASVPAFDHRRAATRERWNGQLEAIDIVAPPERRTVFATALYHSSIKPCFAADESPFRPSAGPFVFDICTMWDIYRTQLPLITALWPDRAVELANALLLVAEEEGNLPIGYRMSRGADRFFRQGSALAHTYLADLCALDPGGIDWEWALVLMESDLRRQYGEDYLEDGIAHPIAHTLDLATGHHCTALVARHVGDDALAHRLDALATRWINAYDSETGLVVDSTFYEGGPWNYSFRLGHDMAGRIEVAGGPERFGELLDTFFGVGADPVKQLGLAPATSDVAAGYALGRFEGLNNEPDMDAPWAYHWLGRPDRTAEIVHAAVHHQFRTGRGGLPGNDDSGGLSSWYVWASLGLFPVAGQRIVLVNAPSFERSQLRLGNGNTLTIDTVGFTEPHADGPTQYVRSATFDGRPLETSWIPLTDLHSGGRLELELGPTPTGWATTAPPSRSPNPTQHRGPHATPRTTESTRSEEHTP